VRAGQELDGLLFRFPFNAILPNTTVRGAKLE